MSASVVPGKQYRGQVSTSRFTCGCCIGTDALAVRHQLAGLQRSGPELKSSRQQVGRFRAEPFQSPVHGSIVTCDRQRVLFQAVTSRPYSAFYAVTVYGAPHRSTWCTAGNIRSAPGRLSPSPAAAQHSLHLLVLHGAAQGSAEKCSSYPLTTVEEDRLDQNIGGHVADIREIVFERHLQPGGDPV